MSRDLAILGASYLQLPLIEKAKAMGYTTHVFAWAADDVGETAADVFYPISIVEKEAILARCRAIGVCGVCSIASDLAMPTVGFVAHALGLACNSPQAVRNSTNKHLMRLAFEAGGDPSPKSVLVDETTDLGALALRYPVIVKPTDRSGSRGIFKLEGPEGLARAAALAMAQSFEKKALIEEFAEGQEYSVEYISHQGAHHFLAATLKYTTGAPHFIETGHLEPAPLSPEALKAVQAIVPHALDSLGLTMGASHTELKIAPDGTIRLIEIGGRMGGDCIGSDLVYYSTGMDYVRMVIQTACGEAPDLTRETAPRAVESRFLLTREDAAELARILRKTPERILKLVDFHPENIGRATDSSNRAGCYILDRGPLA